MFFASLIEGRDMLIGNNKNVDGCYWRAVPESGDKIIAIDEAAGSFAGNDLTEGAVGVHRIHQVARDVPPGSLSQGGDISSDGFADDVVIFQFDGFILLGISAGFFANGANGVHMITGIF